MKEIQKTNATAIAKLDTFNNADEMLETAKLLLRSKMLPDSIMLPEHVVLIAMRGREVGFEMITSLENIYVINNRTTISVHGLNALLKRGHVAHRTIRNYEMAKILKPDATEDLNDPKNYVTDFVTEIEFIRKYKELDNEIIRERVTFSYRDAVKADLANNAKKEPWMKYPKVMIWNRCFTIGAKRVAPDMILGMMETTEAIDTFGKGSYHVDENENVVIDTTGEIVND